MVTKEQAYQNISELVEHFEEQVHSYKRSDYNETFARQGFFTPFFELYGLNEAEIKIVEAK